MSDSRPPNALNHRAPRAVRRRLLLDHIRTSDGSTTVGQLAEILDVSSVTIHRDLDALHKEGLINRVHGGATAIDVAPDQPTTDWTIRIARMRKAKRAIAEAARDRIPEDSTIFLDSSTTCLAVMKELQRRPPKSLNLVTNSPAIVSSIHLPSVHVVVTPGELDQDLRTIWGTWTVEFLRGLHLDLALISGAGITAERGMATTQGALAEILRAAMAVSDRTLALVDSSKCGRAALVPVCPLGSFEAIVIDDGISRSDLQRFTGAGASIVVAQQHAPGKEPSYELT